MLRSRFSQRLDRGVGARRCADFLVARGQDREQKEFGQERTRFKDEIQGVDACMKYVLSTSHVQDRVGGEQGGERSSTPKVPAWRGAGAENSI